VLLIGGPVVAGAGVASFALSLGGWLARRIAARTGRGADVETRSSDRFDTRAAAALLREEELERYDAVVIMMGVRQLMRLRPTSLWRRDVQALLDEIARVRPATVPVLLVGVTPFARDMDAPAFVARWLDAAVERHNEVTRELCERSGAARFVPFDPERSGVRPGRDASAVYESWAVALVPALESALASRHPVPRGEGTDERRRVRALADLDVLEASSDPRLEHIVQMARGMLGYHAALTVLGRDRAHLLSADGGPRISDYPREGTFTNLAVATPGALIIPDVDADPGFAHIGRFPGYARIRFYAGYPLEAPGGERIGVLCVFSTEPATFSADEVSLLRDLALRAQEVLWERGGVG
jgi:GAF domain-containing protein